MKRRAWLVLTRMVCPSGKRLHFSEQVAFHTDIGSRWSRSLSSHPRWLKRRRGRLRNRVFLSKLGALPSPPPWGWSTGFITTPLTTGRLPSQHLDPALPKLFWFTPTLPTCLTVAKQFLDIKRTSPDGNLNVADLPSFAISFATAPAALANCPPFQLSIPLFPWVDNTNKVAIPSWWNVPYHPKS